MALSSPLKYALDDVQPQMCPTCDVSDRHADVFEVGRTSAADVVESSNGHLKQYLLTYWRPVKHVTKNWLHVLILAITAAPLSPL